MDTDRLAETLVYRVARETNRDPLELPSLYETVDPDALAASIQGLTAGTVSFSYAGVWVTVESHGDIHLETTERSPDAADDAVLEASK